MRMACIGIGGYARNYVKAALQLADEGQIDLCGIVERYPERFPEQVMELKQRGIPVYSDMAALFAQARPVGLVAIGTGLHLHYAMTREALAHGAHVYLSKPSVVLAQHADALAEASEKAGRVVGVDFQLAYDLGAQRIKQAIVNGDLGRIRSVAAKAVWNREDSYYSRNGWAGKFKIGADYVLDGPISNPHAHYINNALLFASDKARTFATPESVIAERYRCRDIEGEDTFCLHTVTDDGVEVFAVGTLCGKPSEQITEIQVTGSHGTATWSPGRFRIELHGRDAIAETVPDSTSGDVLRRFVACVKSGQRPLVTIAETRNHVLVLNGAYESSAAHAIPRGLLERTSLGDHDGYVSIPGIAEIVDRSASERRLFSEMDVPWGAPGRLCDLRGYSHFPRS